MHGELGLGKIITTDQERDAIHIAVAPVMAAEKLSPGQAIGFATEGDSENVKASDTPIGIVDPFLSKLVFPGQRFWMFLFPNTVTGLRHDWKHPAWKAGGSKELAEKWLREFADRANLGYDTVIDAAREFLRTGDYYVQHDSERARDAMYEPGTLETFWNNYEILTGEKVRAGQRYGTVFSCSC